MVNGLFVYNVLLQGWSLGCWTLKAFTILLNLQMKQRKLFCSHLFLFASHSDNQTKSSLLLVWLRPWGWQVWAWKHKQNHVISQHVHGLFVITIVSSCEESCSQDYWSPEEIEGIPYSCTWSLCLSPSHWSLAMKMEGWRWHGEH